jgi:NADH:ubiquinone oxidoreductase subunit K
MTATAVSFYVAAVIATVAAASASMLDDARRASIALVVSLAGVTLLVALAGSPVVAAAQAIATFSMAWWLQARDVRDDCVARADATNGRRRWGRVALAVAFFVLTARSLLIVRWPVDATSGAGAGGAWHPGLSHHVLGSLVLFSIGVLAVVLERSSRSVWIGATLMIAASVLAVSAVSTFATGSHDGTILGVLAVALSASTMLVVARFRQLDLAQPVSRRFSDGLVGTIVGMAIALLADAW